MTERRPTVKLAAALVQAQKRISGLKKDARNDFANFDYTSAESMIAAARKALGESDLGFFLDTQTIEPGNPTDHLACRYVLIHASGEEREIMSSTPICPGKGKPMDFAVSAASTRDLSFVLRGLLLIPRVEDEPDAKDPSEEPAKPNDIPKDALAAVNAQVRRLGRARAEKAALQIAKGVPRTMWTKETWEKVAAELPHVDVQKGGPA